MLATTAICIKPINLTTHSNLIKQTRITYLSQRQRFDFISRKSVSWDKGKLFTNKNMSGSVRTRISTDDDNIKAFEQEALIDESTSFGAGGLESTINSLSKWIISVLFGIFLLWRHDAQAFWAAMGAVLNATLSIALKRILNQERPFPTSRSDPGMPSSHAQSIFYNSTFAILSMLESFGWNRYTSILSVLVFAVGTYFSWLRVSQKYHTLSQVVVGAVVGFIFSFLWFWAWRSIILEAFISSLLVRIVVITSAVSLCFGFITYVIRYWLVDEQ